MHDSGEWREQEWDPEASNAGTIDSMMNPAQNPRLPLSAAEEAIDDMLADAFSLVNMETYSFDKPGLD